MTYSAQLVGNSSFTPKPFVFEAANDTQAKRKATQWMTSGDHHGMSLYLNAPDGRKFVRAFWESFRSWGHHPWSGECGEGW